MEIKKAGGEIIALVPDRKEMIEKTKRDHELKFPIYQDTNNQIAKKFGLAFKVDAKVVDIYKGFGINLDQSQGNEKRELPMPGTYVVDSKGLIVYAFFDVDYTKRADLAKVIAALKKAK